MNNVLADILKKGYITLDNGEHLPLHSHLPELEGRLLQAWLTIHKPKNLLEIGMAFGVSSLYICDATRSWSINQYDIIDAFQSDQWQGFGVRHLREAGYGDLYRLHEKRSELCLPEFLLQGMRFDFAFIDGWHTFDQVLVEFYYINRMLEVGGMVIFDDMHLPSLQKLSSYIEAYGCYQRLPIPTELKTSKTYRVRQMMQVPASRIDGFIKTGKDQRDWDWFKDF